MAPIHPTTTTVFVILNAVKDLISTAWILRKKAHNDRKIEIYTQNLTNPERASTARIAPSIMTPTVLDTAANLRFLDYPKMR